jgi:hypothetical protein
LEFSSLMRGLGVLNNPSSRANQPKRQLMGAACVSLPWPSERQGELPLASMGGLPSSFSAATSKETRPCCLHSQTRGGVRPSPSIQVAPHCNGMQVNKPGNEPGMHGQPRGQSEFTPSPSLVCYYASVHYNVRRFCASFHFQFSSRWCEAVPSHLHPSNLSVTPPLALGHEMPGAHSPRHSTTELTARLGLQPSWPRKGKSNATPKLRGRRRRGWRRTRAAPSAIARSGPPITLGANQEAGLHVRCVHVNRCQGEDGKDWGAVNRAVRARGTLPSQPCRRFSRVMYGMLCSHGFLRKEIRACGKIQYMNNHRKCSRRPGTESTGLVSRGPIVDLCCGC